MTRRPLTLAALAAATMLAGCQAYHADPLRPASVALADPDQAVLSADAAKIDRPYLTPQPIDLNQPLTPNALAIITVLENPDLKALRAKNGVTDAQAFAAMLLPDPQIALNFDKILSGPDVFNAYGGSLGIDINALLTAKVARQIGTAQKRQVRLDLAWAEWQSAGQARLQGVRVFALAQQLALAKESAALAERQFTVVASAAGRGDVAGGEVDSRRQAALDAGDKLRLAENGLVTARGELNRQLGLAPNAVISVAPAPDPAPALDAEQLFALALERRLDLAALRAGYQSAEAEVHKSILGQFPTLSLSFNYARDTADNKTIGPAIGFSLPLFNRNRGAIRTATATREQLKAEYEARLFQTRADIRAAVDGLTTVRSQSAALQAQLPALERYAAATARAARNGDLAPITASAAEQALRDRQLTLLQLRQQAAEQTIALELLTGSLSEGWTK
ncbi:MAG: TolC family protein [Proteobacteria bacterium]|nr:TolC family protein [Pseudomonadota bacterium]